MELQTVSQVAKIFGISTRMLRYYEQVGLIQSIRNEENSYRHYDEFAMKRLQQIVILRKLQISIKQIRDILNNQDAVEVIEIFKQNMEELDEKITALTTVKSLLARFVDELQEKANIHMKLDLLTDKSMISLVDSLSVPISRIQEKTTMDELNKASELMRKHSEQNVRIVYHPPATFATIRHNGGDTESDAKARKDSEAIIESFIRETDLYRIKPDLRVFGFGHGNGYGGWELSVTVPDDFDVPAPLIKYKYKGGLYAISAPGIDVAQWVHESDKYEWEPHSAGGEEYVNPFNIYGLSPETSYFEHSMPIKEMEVYSDELVRQTESIIMKASKNYRGEPIDFDLESLMKNGEFDVKYSGGLMEMTAPGLYDAAMMATPREFTLPIKIELRAKTNKTDINMDFGKGWISYNHHQVGKKWFIMDIVSGHVKSYKLRKPAIVDEFVDIEWFMGKDVMVVKLNGEIQHIGKDYDYIKAFKDNPDYKLSAAVNITTTGNSTLTVKSLRVTEI